jgi:hypothetical protein
MPVYQLRTTRKTLNIPQILKAQMLNKEVDNSLRRITIQMPAFEESLDIVLYVYLPPLSNYRIPKYIFRSVLNQPSSIASNYNPRFPKAATVHAL